MPFGFFRRRLRPEGGVPTMSLLAELEAAARGVPAYRTKNDPGPQDDAMVEWLRGRDPSTRSRAMAELPQWLGRSVEAWKNSSAMEIAVRLQDRGLLAEAIAEARRRGVPPAAWRGESVFDRLSFHFGLVSALSRLSTPEGLEYLRELKALSHAGEDPVVTELALRAGIVCCYVQRGPNEVECLRQVLDEVRALSRSDLTRSIVGLLWALYVHHGREASLTGLLNAAELQKLRSLAGVAS